MAGLAILTLLAAGDWSLRYALPADQQPEWDAAGYTAGYAVDIRDAARPEIAIDDAPDGRHRGFVYIGRRFVCGDPAPMALRLRCDYHTLCSLDAPGMRRSGELRAFVMSPAAWSALAAEPGAAHALDPGRVEGLIAQVVICQQGDDVPDWRTGGPIELELVPPPVPGQELIVGVLWGCYHYTEPERGAVRDIVIEPITAAERRWEFWRALDLEQPELAAVQAAVDAGDEPAAAAALAAHLRSRTGPTPANLPGPADARRLERARETLLHTYRLVGAEPYTFDGPILWNADPYHYDQWAIALNRHSEWLDLAAAWLATRDGAYAREWAEQVRAWVAAMPVTIGVPWVEGPYLHPTRKPLSLDAGIRMGQTWFPSFEVLRAAPEVDDATLVDFARSCWQHAVYLMRPDTFHSGSNWGAMEANGLYHLGVLLPEFRDAGTWRDTAVARLAAELTAQVCPDGAQIELAPGYHGVTLGNFLGALELARANGQPLPPEFEAGLERMFDAYARASLPDRTYPPLNDSSRGGIASWLRRGLALFPQRRDWQWLATDGAEGDPPAETSLAFPYAGWVVFRGGWDRNAAWMLFDAGPFGAGHQHEDKLSVLVHAKGAMLLTECGNYAYDDSPERAYALSTRAHNTVRVDGRDQATRRDRSQFVAAAPDEHGFRRQGRFVYAVGDYRGGYGDPPDKSVVHRRRVLFVEPSHWIVVDDLAAADDREHTATAQFLLEATGAEIDERTGTVTSVTAEGAPRLAVVPLAGEPNVRVVSGQREPELLGWVGAAHRALRPVPAALFEKRFTRATTLAYALVPLAAGEPAPAAASFGCTVTPTELRGVAGGETWVAAELALSAAP